MGSKAKFNPKKYFIKTYGCQANVADSESIAGILEAVGFEPLDMPVFKTDTEEFKYALQNCDVLILNSCSVRQKSEDKVYGIGKITKALGPKARALKVLCGCMVGSVSGERPRLSAKILQKKTPWVDLYVSPSDINILPNLLSDRGIIKLKKPIASFNPQELALNKKEGKHAFVNISYGCDNFCSYCVVPYSRGREVHRSQKDILSDILKLTKKGITEVTLCGQNVNSWGLDRETKFKIRAGSAQKLPFADLLREVHKIDNIEKIDFLSSNPFDFTQDLIDAISMPKVSNYIHIAVQSGNNDVLKPMNRRHSIEDFFDLIKRIKKVKPHVEFGTDVIVGFPGETREQFMDTVKLFQTVPFSVAFISMYSPRKGTDAEKYLKDDISLKEKKWRHNYLTNVWVKNKP